MKHYLLVLVTLFLLSCNSNDEVLENSNQDLTNTQKTFLPITLTSSDQTTHFVYDEQNRLISYQENATDNFYSKKYTIHYKNNLVEKVFLNYESQDHYSYTNEYSFKYNTDEVIITNNFKDINDYSVKQTNSIKIDKSNFLKTGHGILAIYDNKKNLTEVIHNNLDTKHTFDNKNAIFKNVNTPQWLLYSILQLGIHRTNNPIKIEYNQTNLNESNTSSITYEYNSEGYPIKRYSTEDDYLTTETEIEYIIK